MDEDWEQVVEDAIKRLQHDPKLEAADLFKTEAEVFDLRTMKTLSKLISDRFLDTVDFCVSTGKEANVFRGTTPEDEPVAVKIYRVHTSSFRSHEEYLIGDHRIDLRGKSNREIIELWAKREFQNLRRFEEVNLRVPQPITVLNNVILMEFIGEGQRIAPLLKDVELADPRDVLNELLAFVETAWEDASLVHGDLSPFNVLALEDDLIVIDTAQSVPREHPRSEELLRRDVENLTSYFQRKGVDHDPEDTLTQLLPEQEAT